MVVIRPRRLADVVVVRTLLLELELNKISGYSLDIIGGKKSVQPLMKIVIVVVVLVTWYLG